MESSSEQRDLLLGDAHGPERQLPPGGGKVERITQQTKSLAQDVTSWIDLKIKLTRLEVEETVEEKKKEAAVWAAIGVFGALAGLFALVALGLGFGALLIAIGLSRPLSYFLGFLLLTLILAAIAFALFKLKPRLTEPDTKKVAVEEERLSPRVAKPRGEATGTPERQPPNL